MRVVTINHVDGTQEAYKAEEIAPGVAMVRGINGGKTVWAYAPRPGDFLVFEDVEEN